MSVVKTAGMGNRKKVKLVLGIAVGGTLSALGSLPVLAEAPYPVVWSTQFGTPADDVASGLCWDSSGNIFVTGYTKGALGGANAGGYDAYLAKYNAAGALQWTTQLGNSGTNQSWSVGTDASGNAYITGNTDGSLSAGASGALFVAKYNSNGIKQWTRQIGPSDILAHLRTDAAGNSYSVGYTSGNVGGANAGGYDAVLVKYDTSGALQWTRQLGTSANDQSFGVALDPTGSNVYITGNTNGALNGVNAGLSDIYLAKYTSAGVMQWVVQTGTSNIDGATSACSDNFGNVYITGVTRGSLNGANAGGLDVFLAKYDSSGSQIWMRQLGTSADDFAYGVNADDAGNIFITGRTDGALGGANAGGTDAFLAKYDPTGNLAWATQMGTAGTEYGLDVGPGPNGSMSVAGWTTGDLVGSNAGNFDAFVETFAVPEPGTVGLLGLSGTILLRRRRGQRV